MRKIVWNNQRWNRPSKNKFKCDKADRNAGMEEREFAIVLQIVGYVLGAVGGLVAIIGGIIGYIFARHRDDNDSVHTEIKEMVKEVREDIRDVHKRIDEVLIGE